MIDPHNITDFTRLQEHRRLEEYLIFCVAVANKTAVVQAQAIDRFLLGEGWLVHNGSGPRQYVKDLIYDNVLVERLKWARTGKYTVLSGFLHQFVEGNPNLKTINHHQLENYYGVGPKTSRFFLLHSRPAQKFIVFDTHVSKWAYNKGLVPFQITPPTKIYEKYEPIVIDYLENEEGITDFADFDLSKWKFGTKSSPIGA